MNTQEIASLASSFGNWQTWAIILAVAGFGALGGLAHKLTAPADDVTSIANYVVVGAIAALAVLFVFVPQDVVRLVALSISAGYAGKAILDALEARVQTALAEAEVDRLRETGLKTAAAGKEALALAQQTSGAATATAQPAGAADQKDASGDLARLTHQLNFLEESFRD